MSKKDNFTYFAAFDKQAAFAEEMALNLLSGIKKGELGTKELIDALHTIENDADETNHLIQARLLEDFTVPLEREGMCSLANELDDVTDSVEDIAIYSYIFCKKDMTADGLTMIELLSDACVSLKKAVHLLGKGSKSKKDLKKHLIKVQTLETECDAIYIEAAHKLYASEMDSEERRIIHTLFDVIEAAMDAVETAAESIETTIAENA